MRVYRPLAAVIAAVLLLAPAGMAQTPTHVQLWYGLGGAWGQVVQDLVKQFNASHPQIQVDAAFQGDYYQVVQKLMAAYAGGATPDIVQAVDTSVPQLAAAHALADLTGFVRGADGLDMKNFIPALLPNGFYKGQMYAVPFNRSTPVLYYNKAMYRAHNIADPTMPLSWTQFQATAQQLTQREGGRVSVYGFETPVDYWFWESLLWSAGGAVFDPKETRATFDSPVGVETVNWWKQMTDAGIMKAPTPEGFKAWDVARADFIQGVAAMIFSSSADINYLSTNSKFPVGVTFMPAKIKGAAATGGSFLAVPAYTKHAKEAWTFIRWAVQDPQMYYWVTHTGYVPVTRSALAYPQLQAYYKAHPEYYVPVAQLLRYGHSQPTSPIFNGSFHYLGDALREVVLGHAAAEKALQQAAAQIDQQLATVK
jgi:sn-glycerol 3-phosphate transport system substrate-binding protein